MFNGKLCNNTLLNYPNWQTVLELCIGYKDEFPRWTRWHPALFSKGQHSELHLKQTILQILSLFISHFLIHLKNIFYLYILGWCHTILFFCCKVGSQMILPLWSLRCKTNNHLSLRAHWQLLFVTFAWVANNNGYVLSRQIHRQMQTMYSGRNSPTENQTL